MHEQITLIGTAKKQAVEQVISVFLVSAGTKNQAAAG